MSILDFLGKRGEEKTASVRRSLSQQMMDEIRNNMQQDFGEQPEKKSDLDCFCTVLEQEISEHLKRRQTTASSEEGQDPELQAVDALSLFHVSEDHMEAYACLLSPLNGGSGVVLDHFLEDMRYGGITFGIDHTAVSELISDQQYLRIVQVAQGQWPKDGRDGELEELFERRSEQPLELNEDELQEGMDFRKHLLQSIRRGEIICRVKEPVMAQDGKDVSGRCLPGRAGAAVRIPEGENTRLTEDGSLLLAEISGIVVMAGDDFTVQKLNVIEKDVDALTGDMEFDGNVLIRGDIKGGITISASGNIIIDGSVLGGKIISSGTIRVQGEIKGDSETQLQAGRQIQCTIMENAVATAKEDICAEVVADSTVISESGCIYALIGRGLIFGGNIKAHKSIYAKKIGNVSGCENRFMLGYAPDLEKQIADVRTELADTQKICEKLRKNISDMQASGMNLQRDKRELYSKLMEQRMLYEELKRKKAKKLKELEIRLYSIKSSVLSCDEMHPVTRVYIRGQELIIQNRETACRVHMPADQILLK